MISMDKKSEVIHIRLSTEDKEKLLRKHPHKNEVGKVLRGLLKMYLQNKIQKIEYTENLT